MKEKILGQRSLPCAKQEIKGISHIIQMGAEAIILKQKDSIIKKRVKKGYRFKDLDDKIRRNRTKREVRILKNVSKFIPAPKVLKFSKYEIEMEFLDGEKLSESLDKLKNWKKICFEIGQNIAQLHDADIIHGDLTTSNMVFLRNRVYFIDYGLSYGNGRIEDKAVDLHLIKHALEAKHFNFFEKFWKEILNGYKISKDFKEIMKRFERVEKRGRYKMQS